MRVAASRASVRACRRQSHRVTRRSEPMESDFQPVPSHREQTSTETFMTWAFSLLQLCTRGCILRKWQRRFVCAHPVKLRIELWRSEEIDLLLEPAATARTLRNRRRCFHSFFDDLEKCLRLLA